MIFVCRQCGMENHVPDTHRRDGTFFCGNCHKPLTIAIGAIFHKDIQQKKRLSKTSVFRGYFLFVATIVVLGLWWSMRNDASPRNDNQVKPHTVSQKVVAHTPTTVHRSSIYKSPIAVQRVAQSDSPIFADQMPPVAHPPKRGDQNALSLLNGTELVRQGINGLGSLTIENGTDFDAIVKLVGEPDDSQQTYGTDSEHLSVLNSEGKTYYEMYVQQGHKAVISSIGPGAYRVKFCLGNDWQLSTRQFANVQAYSAFAAPLIFDQTVEVSDTGSQTHFHRYNITLNATLEGTAQTDNIPKSDFDNPAK